VAHLQLVVAFMHATRSLYGQDVRRGYGADRRCDLVHVESRAAGEGVRLAGVRGGIGEDTCHGIGDVRNVDAGNLGLAEGPVERPCSSRPDEDWRQRLSRDVIWDPETLRRGTGGGFDATSGRWDDQGT
jgi:hypothetical protein